MLKQVVGPFEFHKIVLQEGSGCMAPNDFTKCCVHLKCVSFIGTSSKDTLVNSFTYNTDCNTDITIGLGKMFFESAIDLCLQTMVTGEIARFEIAEISSRLESVDKNNTKSGAKEVPQLCNLDYSDHFPSNVVCDESVREGCSVNVQNCDIFSAESDTNCKTEDNIEHNLQAMDKTKSTDCSECSSSNNISKTCTEPVQSSCFSSYLIVDISLVSFSLASDVHRLSGDELLGRAVALKDIGVDCFKRSDIPTAFYKFSRSLKYLLVCSMNETEVLLFDKWNLLRCQCYLNMAACQLQRENYASAKLNCSRCLELDARNVKGLFRRAQASIKLNEYEDAQRDLQCAVAIEPSSATVLKSLNAVQNVLRTRDKKLGEALSKLFK